MKSKGYKDTIRAKCSKALRTAVQHYAEQQAADESTVVRIAVGEYLQKHGLSSAELGYDPAEEAAEMIALAAVRSARSAAPKSSKGGRSDGAGNGKGRK